MQTAQGWHINHRGSCRGGGQLNCGLVFLLSQLVFELEVDDWLVSVNHPHLSSFSSLGTSVFCWSYLASQSVTRAGPLLLKVFPDLAPNPRQLMF